MMTPTEWLEQQHIQIDDKGSIYTSRILKVRSYTIAISALSDGKKTIWPKPGTLFTIKLSKEQDITFQAEVVEKHLNPIPLLILKVIDDLPLGQIGRLLHKPQSQNSVIAISSGKGGTGKTFFAVNLAIALSRKGYRVTLIDGDLGTANIAVSLGLKPQYTLNDVINGTKQINSLLTATGFGFRFIPGAEAGDLANVSPWQLSRIQAAVSEVSELADYTIIDTGAGLSRASLSFLYAAQQVLLVTTSEPPALLDAYGVLKTFQNESASLTLDEQNSKASFATKKAPRKKWGLIVNRVSDEQYALNAAAQFTDTSQRFLGMAIPLFGMISEDSHIGDSYRKQVPLLSNTGISSPAQRDILKLAEKLTVSKSVASGAGAS